MAEVVPFLQAVYGLDRGLEQPGFIRLAVINPEHGWPGQPRWISVDDLQSMAPGFSVNDVLNPVDSTGANVYFTPHLFTRTDPRSQVTKEDAVAQGCCAWVECDDPDLEPEAFSPRPSVVISTSHGRHHIYWFLDRNIDLKEIEKLNWRLVHGNKLRKDTGGWHLVKFMRVPDSYSYKRTDPYLVKIKSWEASRIYDPTSDFDMLPSAPDDDEFLLNADRQVLDVPDETTRREQLDILRDHPVSREVMGLLERREPDRSQALWRIYNGAIRVGIPSHELFWLVRRSPNDKFFHNWRYNQDAGLWADIQRAYVMAQRSMDIDSPVLMRIKEVNLSKDAREDKQRKIARIIHQDLLERGRIFYDPNTREALYLNTAEAESTRSNNATMRVMTISAEALDWRAFFSIRYNIVRGQGSFMAIHEYLYSFAREEGEVISPKRFSYYDRDHNLLYIHSGGRYMYRLDGDPQGITRLDNGDEGVLFRDHAEITPFTADMDIAQRDLSLREYRPLDESSVPLIDEIFSYPNFDGTQGTLSPVESAQLAKVWVYALFFPEIMETRPHLVIAGPTASGKTFFFQTLMEIFSGPGQKVQSVPNDQNSFETGVSNYPFMFYDNVDTPNKWLTDSIAAVATGIQYTRRILYTTNDSTQLVAQCFLGITTRDPWFSRIDVSTRLLVLSVERLEAYKSPLAMMNVIRDNRSQLWGQLLWDLNHLVAEIGKSDILHNDKEASGSAAIRMAVFDHFIRIAAKVFPRLDPDRLVQAISNTQNEATREHSIIWMALSSWLMRTNEDGEHPNVGRTVMAKDLHTALAYEALDQGVKRRYEATVPNSKSLARQLRELLPVLRHDYDVTVKEHPQGARYTFNFKEGKTNQAQGDNVSDKEQRYAS